MTISDFRCCTVHVSDGGEARCGKPAVSACTDGAAIFMLCEEHRWPERFRDLEWSDDVERLLLAQDVMTE